MMMSNVLVLNVLVVYSCCEDDSDPLASTRVAETSTTAQWVAVPSELMVPPDTAGTVTLRPFPTASLGAPTEMDALARDDAVTLAYDPPGSELQMCSWSASVSITDNPLSNT